MAGILFLFCDAGETNALLPVVHELQIRKEDVRILAMSNTAISKLENDSSLEGKVIKLKELVDTAKDRTKPLEDLAEAIKDLKPLLVISGAASKAQRQLVEALGAKSIIYLDNFNYATTNPSFETVKDVASVGNEIICPSNKVKKQIDLKDKSVTVMGRPSLENWVSEVQKVKSEGYVTFIGGYGPRYVEGVNDAYAEAIKKLKEAGYKAHLQPHPNVEKPTLDTKVAVGMADFVVCYDSTVGFESLFAGKNVIYLQPENVAPYDNIAIKKGLASRVKNPEELLEALKNQSSEKKDPYEVLGVEKKSTEMITKYIQEVYGRVH